MAFLLAVDVGNSHTVYGLHDGAEWGATWRRATNVEDTEDEIAAWLFSLMDSPRPDIEAVAVASVVPGLDATLRLFAAKYVGREAIFLTATSDHGIPIAYDPPQAVGADRIANAIAALAVAEPPLVVVDFGTATTFDVVDASGTYVGGAIMAGPVTALQALAGRAAKLPAVELRPPEAAIGRNTVAAIRSGAVYGHAGAIEAIVRRIVAELGGTATALATGGLAREFMPLCPTIEREEPMLTLEGLRQFRERVQNRASDPR